MGKLPGRVAIVTGAAQNIGAAIALRLAAEGAAVAVNYRGQSSAAEAGDVVQRIRAAGGTAVALQADVSQESEVRHMVAEARSLLGLPTILVNNAATSVATDVEWGELTVDDWTRVLATNVVGGFVCAREVFPSMLERTEGAVINISSIRPLLGLGGNLHYTTSKAAQIGFTRALAREVSSAGVRVNTVIVGAIESDSEAVYGSVEEVNAMVLAGQAIQRRGTAEDVADAVLFLCAGDSGFITGQSLVVDGGWAMQ